MEPGAVIWHQLPVLVLPSPTLMRLSHCESHCAGPFRFIPCLPQSKDASRDAASPPAPRPAAVAEEEPPPVQKIEVPVAAGKDDDDAEKREDSEKAAAPAPVPVPGKSCLKKTSCGDGEFAGKGNVKWLDLLGKDLTEIKEYEPSECGDLLDDGDGISTCVCVIQ